MSQSLKQFLKDFVTSRVKMTESDRKAKVKIADDIVAEFITCMKEMSPLFKELYQTIYYTGSYYEGLKVREANEFDRNVILNLPFTQDEIQVIASSVPKGFVKYKLTKCCLEQHLARHPKWSIFKNLDKIMDSDHKHLSRAKLNAWFQSLVTRMMEANKDKFSNVKFACCGPAITLTITSPTEECKLCVDLVPVVKLPAIPDSVTEAEELRNVINERPICFIVPKPPVEHIKDQCERADHDKIFRVSIPEAEKLLMADIGCFKMLVKIFKAIRDEERWTFLSSYYIKTVFMWQLVRNPEPEFWKEENLGQLFIMMLKEFIDVLTKKSLDHIFFEGYNLLQGPQQYLAAKNKFQSLLKYAEIDVLTLNTMYSLQSLGLTN